ICLLTASGLTICCSPCWRTKRAPADAAHGCEGRRGNAIHVRILRPDPASGGSYRENRDIPGTMKIARLIALVLAAFAVLAGASAAPRAAGPQIDFGAFDNVIDLRPALLSYHAPNGKQAGIEADGSVWYMLTVTNSSVRPASRVLIAGQPPRVS